MVSEKSHGGMMAFSSLLLLSLLIVHLLIVQFLGRVRV